MTVSEFDFTFVAGWGKLSGVLSGLSGGSASLTSSPSWTSVVVHRKRGEEERSVSPLKSDVMPTPIARTST